MVKELYDSPKVEIVSLEQRDVVCTSNFEMEFHDVMEDDRVFWD